MDDTDDQIPMDWDEFERVVENLPASVSNYGLLCSTLNYHYVSVNGDTKLDAELLEFLKRRDPTVGAIPSQESPPPTAARVIALMSVFISKEQREEVVGDMREDAARLKSEGRGAPRICKNILIELLALTSRRAVRAILCTLDRFFRSLITFR